MPISLIPFPPPPPPSLPPPNSPFLQNNQILPTKNIRQTKNSNSPNLPYKRKR